MDMDNVSDDFIPSYYFLIKIEIRIQNRKENDFAMMKELVFLM